MSDFCYWCGGPATSREHVPPKSFYPESMRSNLITVPSCTKHNEDLNELDERFRVYLQGTSNDRVAVEAFEDKTLRGLKASRGLITELAARAVPARLNGEETKAIPIPSTEHDLFLEKIARGIYRVHFQTHFAGKICCACSHLSAPHFDFRDLILIYKSMERDFIPGQTTNDRVFKYSYARGFDGGKELYALRATFYSNITVIGFGIGK